MDDSTAICSDCATNVHLKQRIVLEGSPLLCTVCGQVKPHVFDINRLAHVLATIFRQNFGTGETRFVPSDDDRDYSEPCGDSLETIVSEMLGQDLDFLDELIMAIVESEGCSPQDGNDCFFSGDALYSRVCEKVSLEYFDYHWNNLISELKHRRRFFSKAVQQFFNGIFSDIETVNTWGTDGRTVENVICNMAQGMTVYRARVIEADDAKDIIAEPYL